MAAPPLIASHRAPSPSFAPRPMSATAERPREVLCRVPGERFPGGSLLGEAVGIKKTEVKEQARDTAKASKLDGIVGSTAFDSSALPFITKCRGG